MIQGPHPLWFTNIATSLVFAKHRLAMYSLRPPPFYIYECLHESIIEEWQNMEAYDGQDLIMKKKSCQREVRNAVCGS